MGTSLMAVKAPIARDVASQPRHGYVSSVRLRASTTPKVRCGGRSCDALSHTHGDHIGNVRLFPDSTVLIRRAEYEWISSPDGPNDNVNQLKALARKLMGTPKHLRLLDGDTDVFGDGSVTLVFTPGHTPGSQSLMVHLKNSGFIILSGDVVHLEENFEKDTVPSLNTDKTASIGSMERIRRMIATYKAKFFINHDKAESDALKLIPAFYD